jgi:hypothetical protein
MRLHAQRREYGAVVGWRRRSRSAPSRWTLLVLEILALGSARNAGDIAGSNPPLGSYGYRWRQAGLAVAAVALIAGCADPGATARPAGAAGRAGPEPTERLRPVVAPPERVPVARAPAATGRGTVPGQVVYQVWLVDGKVRRGEAATAPPSGAPVGAIRSGEPFRLELGTSVPPARMQVLAYRDVDRAGVPTGDAEQVSCEAVPAKATCTYTVSGVVSAAVMLTAAPRVVVVNAGWYVPADMRKHDQRIPAEVSASWAFTAATNGAP